jgi:hypothetical protein
MTHLHRVVYSGEKNGRALLSKEQVLEIKQKYIPYKYSAKKLPKKRIVDTINCDTIHEGVHIKFLKQLKDD